MACEHKVILSYLWSHMHVFTGTCPSNRGHCVFILSIYNILIYKKNYISHIIYVHRVTGPDVAFCWSRLRVFSRPSENAPSEVFGRSQSDPGLYAIHVGRTNDASSFCGEWSRGDGAVAVVSKNGGGCQGSWITQIFYVCIVYLARFG